MAKQQVQQQLSLAEYEQQLRDKAQAGDPIASFLIVEHFERRGAAENLLEAQHRVNYLMHASNQGVGAASVLLGSWYLEGYYVPKDLARAILFFEHAGNQGKEPLGFYRLAELFEQGIHVPANVEKAQAYLKKAVDGGNPDAIFTLALKKLETDTQQAFKLLNDNYTKTGHVRSLLLLNDDTRFDRQKVQTLIEANSKDQPFAAALHALYLFQNNQIAEAQPLIEFAKQADNPIGFYLSALIALNNSEFEQAQQDMLAAANLGHIEAAYRAAVFISQQVDQIEDEKQHQKETQKMLKLFAQAAQEGFAPAQFSLAQCWLQGIGVEQNQQEALNWLDRAAQQGHIDSIFTLAINLPVDHPQHFRLLDIAAQAGHSKAMLCIGMYLQNSGQAEQAIGWFNQAKAANDPRADYLLGQAYFVGNGIEVDAKQALEYFKSGSDNGDSDAHFALYEAYRDGVGVRRNKKSQAKYLKLAKEAQHPRALELAE